MNNKSELLTQLDRLSKVTCKNVKGGASPGGSTTTGHSCSGLQIDCWCDAHCFTGIDCTKAWK